MPSLLVIDDEDSILHAFRRVFQGGDITLFTAASGKEGLQAIKKYEPDVVILDINLPDISGLDVFRKIHAEDDRGAAADGRQSGPCGEGARCFPQHAAQRVAISWHQR